MGVFLLLANFIDEMSAFLYAGPAVFSPNTAKPQPPT